MFNVQKGLLALVVATLLPGLAYAQGSPGGQLGGPLPVSQQTPGTPPATPASSKKTGGKNLAPRELFPNQVHGANILMPVLRNHCRLDSNQPADKTFIDTFLKDFGTTIQLTMLTMDCQSHRLLRSGISPSLLNLMAYMTPTQAPSPNLASADKKAVAQQICSNVTAQNPGVKLTASTAKERAFELQNLSASGTKVAGALQTSQRACYFGDISPLQATGQTIRQVQGWTLVKGRLIAIAAISTDGTDVERLMGNSGNLIVDMTTANGEL